MMAVPPVPERTLDKAHAISQMQVAGAYYMAPGSISSRKGDIWRMKNTNKKKRKKNTNAVKANQKYKDTVFRLLFGESRDELLNLYNAVNDPEFPIIF